MYAVAFAQLQVSPALVNVTPVGRSWGAAGGSLALLDLRETASLVIPAPAGELRLGWPLARRVDLSLRYSTVAFVTHDIGGRLRYHLVGGASWALAASVEAAVALVPWLPWGAFFFGEAHVRAAISGGFQVSSSGVMHAEVGVSGRMLEVSVTDQGAFHDARPTLRTAAVQCGYSWGGRSERRYQILAGVAFDPLDVLPAGLATVHLSVGFEVVWLR
jgi:hypothetical protein